MVRVVSNRQPALVVPIPTFLLRRFTEGVYYEICGIDGFSEAFGCSFQNYVGEVLASANQHSGITITPEERYHVGKGRRKG
jgi:hypothetical protein